MKYFRVFLFSMCLIFILSSLVNCLNYEEPNNDVVEVKPNNTIDNSTVNFSEKNYVAIGDSITFGFCGDHSLPPFSNNYPHVVKNLVGFKTVQNLGACGCLLARHSNSAFTSMIDKVDVISSEADVISVFGGINDYSTYVPLGDINSTDEFTVYGALNSIAVKLQSCDAFCFFITPLPLSSTLVSDVNNNSYSIADVSDAIKAVGEKYSIPVFDAYRYGSFEPDVDGFDGCHPTEAYYLNELGPLIAEFIKQNYKQK